MLKDIVMGSTCFPGSDFFRNDTGQKDSIGRNRMFTGARLYRFYFLPQW